MQSLSKTLQKTAKVDSPATRKSLILSKKKVSISQKDALSSRNLSMSATKAISLSLVMSKKLPSNRLRLQWEVPLPRSLLQQRVPQGLKTSLKVFRRTKRRKNLSLSLRNVPDLLGH